MKTRSKSGWRGRQRRPGWRPGWLETLWKHVAVAVWTAVGVLGVSALVATPAWLLAFMLAAAVSLTTASVKW